MNKLELAYKKGFTDFFANVKVGDNPYSESEQEKEHWKWMEGFSSATASKK